MATPTHAAMIVIHVDDATCDMEMLIVDEGSEKTGCKMRKIYKIDEKGDIVSIRDDRWLFVRKAGTHQIEGGKPKSKIPNNEYDVTTNNELGNLVENIIQAYSSAFKINHINLLVNIMRKMRFFTADILSKLNEIDTADTADLVTKKDLHAEKISLAILGFLAGPLIKSPNQRILTALGQLTKENQKILKDASDLNIKYSVSSIDIDKFLTAISLSATPDNWTSWNEKIRIALDNPDGLKNNPKNSFLHLKVHPDPSPHPSPYPSPYNKIKKTDMINTQILNKEFLDELNKERAEPFQTHLLLASGRFSLQIKNRTSGFPKGEQKVSVPKKPDDDADLLATAIREFKEETEHEFTHSTRITTLPKNELGGGAGSSGPLLNTFYTLEIIRSNGKEYQPYVIFINDAKKHEIMQGQSVLDIYNSEVFNIKFVPINQLSNPNDPTRQCIIQLINVEEKNYGNPVRLLNCTPIPIHAPTTASTTAPTTASTTAPTTAQTTAPSSQTTAPSSQTTAPSSQTTTSNRSTVTDLRSRQQPLNEPKFRKGDKVYRTIPPFSRIEGKIEEIIENIQSDGSIIINYKIKWEARLQTQNTKTISDFNDTTQNTNAKINLASFYNKYLKYKAKYLALKKQAI